MPRGVLPYQEVGGGGGGLGPGIEFRGKIWGKVQSSSPIRGKEDKNSIPQCIGQSHITMAFPNMVPFPSRTRVRQMCARCAVKRIKLYDIHGKRKQVMPICTGDRTFAGQTYYDGLS